MRSSAITVTGTIAALVVGCSDARDPAGPPVVEPPPETQSAPRVRLNRPDQIQQLRIILDDVTTRLLPGLNPAEAAALQHVLADLVDAADGEDESAATRALDHASPRLARFSIDESSLQPAIDALRLALEIAVANPERMSATVR